MSNGKASEHNVVRRLEQKYGTKVEINRLVDTFDTGKLEDPRPSDFILMFNPELALTGTPHSCYLEVKSSEAQNMSFVFSTLRKGQRQAMQRATNNGTNYFVVYENLKHGKMYLITGLQIIAAMEQGIKAFKPDVMQEWNGELYDQFR